MSLSEQRLAEIRSSMRINGIDALIIPNTDPHLGENIPENWRIVDWLTGFTGSSALVVITEGFAGLWTDSRYFIQAENQLHDSGFVLMKPPPSGKYDYLNWLGENLDKGSTIDIDGRTLSIDNFRKINSQTGGKNFIINSGSELISGLWAERINTPFSLGYDHPVSFCGKTREEKLKEVRSIMKTLKVNYHLLTSVDDIMWLLNIRGNDLKYSPLMLSFAIIGEDQVLLFAEENKIPQNIAREFDKLAIVILPYEETAGMLSTIPPGSSILLDPVTTSVSLFNAISPGISVSEDLSIPTRLKAVKNRVEIENIGKVMIRDGVALTRFFFWIEKNYGSVPMSELSLTEKLNHVRGGQENYLSPSFATITAYNAHGALPHYTPDSSTDSVIGQGGLLLVDSGGQYLDGTTDITRTISLGTPTAQQIKDFTLVLKGVIGLASVKFPSGTRGYQLDIIARKTLWENGLNYGHGTGHGVGFCLNVHEGPQSISPFAATGSKTVIEPGMLISDEPAIYREGEYGIRIENLIICYEDEETEFGTFLKFDTVSLCYIDKSLIDTSLLDLKEINWLNSYHAEVYHKLRDHLTQDENEWLSEKTASL